jgi:hypothetical protein
MSMNKTRFQRKRVLDHSFGRIAYAFPADVWLALFTADPTELGSQDNELTQAGYARVAISDLMADAILAGGVIANAALIEIGPAAEDWPEVTHIGIMTALTAGDMTYFGPCVTSRAVDTGDKFKVSVNQLTIEER